MSLTTCLGEEFGPSLKYYHNELFYCSSFPVLGSCHVWKGKSSLIADWGGTFVQNIQLASRGGSF